MAQEYDRSRPASTALGPTTAMRHVSDAVEIGYSGDKVVFSDRAASPLGTGNEAVGLSDGTIVSPPP